MWVFVSRDEIDQIRTTRAKPYEAAHALGQLAKSKLLPGYRLSGDTRPVPYGVQAMALKET